MYIVFEIDVGVDTIRFIISALKEYRSLLTLEVGHSSIVLSNK